MRRGLEAALVAAALFALVVLVTSHVWAAVALATLGGVLTIWRDDDE